MALAHTLGFFSPSVSFNLSKLPLTSSKNHLAALSCTSPQTTASLSTEQEVLKAVVESDGKTLPCVRTYENDVAHLTLVGAVGFDQALTAAAADGGQAANEHVHSGFPAMVVETVFPGSTEERATVATRLFLPAGKVKERANKLRKSLAKDILFSSTSTNILAMTFRQVVMQQLWNFELVLFRPGTERNMEDLEKPREVPASFILRSSDEWLISMLSEVVCMSALQTTERHFLDNLLGETSSKFFLWFQRLKKIVSKDSSVIVYKLFEDEIVRNAKSLLETFNSMKDSVKPVKTIPKHLWWTPSAHSKLEKIGGPEFSAWTSEYVPAYRLEIDASRLEGVKFEGWRKSAENRWEILLTHSQMVGLADILDMYYEDVFSLPNKQLSCGVVASYTNLSNKKRNSSFLKILSVTLASGIFLVTISALGQLCLPHLCKGKKFSGEHRSLPSSEIQYAIHQPLDAAQLEALCISIVKRIKDAFNWHGDIMTEMRIGAWIGEIPNYLLSSEDDSSRGEDSTDSASLEKIDADIKLPAQDIASYQVVLSTDGKIVGFQPTSRVGVNHWATNPIAKELYGGRKLTPGLIEPSLKIHLPNEVVLIELLMSVNPDSCFALARPIQQ
ncbi:Deneddylase ORF24 [Melia azedarach]|uniref:Deneddylase ORF24 n=1 Tax=Melia azedarach TaxID=155640 RepID=A0ACC1WYM3_MELAZ|nr:Deneddylase ORF24 [Melia azedarach]